MLFPDTVVDELTPEVQRLGYTSVSEMLKGTLRTLLLGERLERAESTVKVEVEKDRT